SPCFRSAPIRLASNSRRDLARYDLARYDLAKYERRNGKAQLYRRELIVVNLIVVNLIVVNLDILHSEVFPSTVQPRRPANGSDQDARTSQRRYQPSAPPLPRHRGNGDHRRPIRNAKFREGRSP